MRSKVFFLCLFAAMGCLQAQPISKNDVPFIGAQVFIEPGQTPHQIDEWYGQMEEAGMTVCRIRLFQQYMENADGTWDFSLFDAAFDAARRHHVKVYGTLFPTTDRTDIGGWKFPADEAQHQSFARFIAAIVSHYSKHPALKGWVIINEPGTGGDVPKTPFSEKAWQQWQQSHPDQLRGAGGYPVLTAPRRQAFTRDFTADYLQWIAAEVRRYDSRHDIHVNPADVFGNSGDYDWCRWQGFLTSLGGSAHPSWHYYHFDRSQYALAMGLESQMLRGGAGSLPWFMTEIQGGNNIYSGGRALCPTPQEIAQWLWVVIASEGKGGIFWMLNPRASGIEAGEWALLNYQGRPSERMLMAGRVADVLHRYESFFATARQPESTVNIVYSKESRWAEQLMAHGDEDRFDGRRGGAVLKSVAACYQALAGYGIQAAVTALDSYDFSRNDYGGHTIILPNQIALPRSCYNQLEKFVNRGGTLIVEGLTGYFDEQLCQTVITGSDLYRLLGNEVKEYICRDDTFSVTATTGKLPGHWQQGLLARGTDDISVSLMGRGRVVWVPSCVALGAWVTRNFEPLAEFLVGQLPKLPANCLNRYVDGLWTSTLQRGSERVTVYINKSSHKLSLSSAEKVTSSQKPQLLFSTGHSPILTLEPEEVQVVIWK